MYLREPLALNKFHFSFNFRPNRWTLVGNLLKIKIIISDYYLILNLFEGKNAFYGNRSFVLDTYVLYVNFIILFQWK